MVSRGSRNIKRSRHEDERSEEEEEVNIQNTVTEDEAARLREARYLAEEALRLATEARDAARRLRECQARIALRSRMNNLFDGDDNSSLREGDDDFRSP